MRNIITKNQKLKTLLMIHKNAVLFQDAFFIWEQIKNLKHKNESQLITICMKIDSIPDLEFATQFVIQHSWFYPVKFRFFSV